MPQTMVKCSLKEQIGKGRKKGNPGEIRQCAIRKKK